jgi:hypothetical protein
MTGLTPLCAPVSCEQLNSAVSASQHTGLSTHHLFDVILIIIVAGVCVSRLCSMNARCDGTYRVSASTWPAWRGQSDTHARARLLPGLTVCGRSTSAVFPQVVGGQRRTELHRCKCRCLKRML